MENQKITFTAIMLALVSFTFLPQTRAVVPPPDGGYPNFTTAEGQNALLSLTTGVANTGVGWFSLKSVTTGNANTGVGAGTLLLNSGDSNTAMGAVALLSNITGIQNTAAGAFALFSNTEGSNNTAVGIRALTNNITGNANSAFGTGALLVNTAGGGNSAFGGGALFAATGNFNSASGSLALTNLATGDYNTALGKSAGESLTTGTGNVYIGEGMAGQNSEDNHTYIRNINMTTVGGGNADLVSVDLVTGLLGHVTSSRRYKEDIQPMKNASETLYQLNPVTFRYNKEIDPTQSLDYGLVAEDVAEIDPKLANRNRDGQIESVRYSAINAMLLNEFLKEHQKVAEQARKIQEQETTIAALKQEMQNVVARLSEQDAKIQKVSDRVETSENERRVVVNEPLIPCQAARSRGSALRPRR